jgi:hypothetical protein
MNPKQFTAGILFLVILISPLVLAKETDGPIISRVSKLAWDKSRESIPARANILAPFAAFRAGDALPVEERVRIRIETDKQLEGIRVEVWPGEKTGVIKLRGVVPGQDWKNRAGSIASSTVGVDTVVNELAIPEIRN